MDFPVFHLDFIGNRMLIAITAIVHVIVNHPMAVGAIPLATFVEWLGHKRKNPELDKFAYNFTFVFFIITTSLGALTGVGIWFTTSQVNPDAIGSLIHIFFWGWFSEWIVFVIEVCLIMLYFLSWKKMQGKAKSKHIKIGIFLSIFSWITMAIITGILAFMMNSGKWVPYIREWTENSGMWTAFFNPLYIPQLAFRTPFALMTAGLFFLFLVHFFTKEKNKTFQSIVRTISIWSLFFLPFTIIAGYWYWKRVPQFMQDNAPIAITTQNYTSWYQTILLLLVILLIITILTALLGIIKPKILPRLLLLVPFIVGIMLLGYFERIREFVRKPYVISDYMYANGLLVQNYPLYKESGILAHATYAKYKTITPENKLDAGSELFMLTCSRCHTMNGINGVNKKFQKLFPNGQWQIDQISNFIAGMHNIRTFMPPFPGNKEELDALAFFICHYQNTQHRFEGAQSAGLNFGKTQ